MPRLPPSLIKRAWCVSPLLPLLLRTCRTLESARHELRWLREHVLERAHGNGQLARLERYALLTLCQQRSRGVPLQYLLGSQPFGELDIICRPGVLIPRFVVTPMVLTRECSNIVLGRRRKPIQHMSSSLFIKILPLPIGVS
jgi:hypothetical protein